MLQRSSTPAWDCSEPSTTVVDRVAAALAGAQETGVAATHGKEFSFAAV